MSETVQPALTPEQWDAFDYDAVVTDDPYGWETGESAYVFANTGQEILYIADEDGRGEKHVARIKSPAMRHAVAALCLHGQPFGFRRDDVKMLRAVAAHYGGSWKGKQAASLAERIAAILPPEDNT